MTLPYFCSKLFLVSYFLRETGGGKEVNDSIVIHQELQKRIREIDPRDQRLLVVRKFWPDLNEDLSSFNMTGWRIMQVCVLLGIPYTELIHQGHVVNEEVSELHLEAVCG